MAKKIDVGGELNSTALDKKLVDAAQVKDGSRGEKTLVETNEEIEYLLAQEGERQKQFEANEAARQAEADKTEQDRADEAARTEAERQATFEANEAERQVLYEKVEKNTEDIDLLNANTGISEYPEFSEAKAYAVGEVVLYEGLLKRFTSAHAAGAWDASQVEDWSNVLFATGEKVNEISIDDEPTAGSENLVKSSSLYSIYKNISVPVIHEEVEEESVTILDDNDNTVLKITENYVDGKNLKSNGTPVLTEHQDISGKQDTISEIEINKKIIETPEIIEIQDNEGNTKHTIKEDEANFTGLKSGGIRVLTDDDLISNIVEKPIGNDTDEISYETEDGSSIVKVGSYGMKSKAYLDLDGKDILNDFKGALQRAGSNTNCPIVVFIYDDNTADDDTLISMLDERGLKGTLATIGDVTNLSPKNALGVKLKSWVNNGHGTIGHGVTIGSGKTGTGNGLNTMCDDDCYKAINANNRYLDYFALSHKGIAYFNRWEYNPHTVSIIGQYYNYGFIFGGDGFNTPSTDRYKLTRYSTDNATMLNGAKTLVDSAIGRNCIIAFGGHMNRTGTGDSYSSMADFTELLDYVAEKVSNHQMLSLNSDKAIELFDARCNTLGGIKTDKQYIPSVGQYCLGENGIEVCSNNGNIAIFDIALSGTVSAGSFRLSNISTTVVTGIEGEVVNYLDITITTQTTIEEVISLFLKSIYREYTALAHNSNTVRLYANVSKVMAVPEVVSNTTSVKIAITQVMQGSQSIWL